MIDEDAIALVKEAVKQGITLFDTTPNYGKGNSERLLGIALKPFREKAFINSKFGHSVEATDFSANKLEYSVRES